MEEKRIRIAVKETKAIPEEVIRMAQEHDVELVKAEDIKQEEYDSIRTSEQVYTFYSRPEIPNIEWCEPLRRGKGGSKCGRSEKQIRKDHKKNKMKKTHRRRK